MVPPASVLSHIMLKLLRVVGEREKYSITNKNKHCASPLCPLSNQRRFYVASFAHSGKVCTSEVCVKDKLPQGMNAKEFLCTKNIFNKALSCQEYFVVYWPKAGKYVNNVGYCHTKYGNIVTSQLWCASGNA